MLEVNLFLEPIILFKRASISVYDNTVKYFVFGNCARKSKELRHVRHRCLQEERITNFDAMPTSLVTKWFLKTSFENIYLRSCVGFKKLFF